MATWNDTQRRHLIHHIQNAEVSMHQLWGAHCAGASCKPEHKQQWQEIQGVLGAAIAFLQKLERDRGHA